MTTQGKRRDVFPWSLFLKWAAAVTTLGAYAVGTYLLWGAVHEPLFLKWVLVAALAAYAVGICFLLGVVREPLLLKWTIVKWAIAAVALGVYAVGIYLLWGLVREPHFLQWAAVAAALGVCAVGILLLWGVWDGTPVAAAFTRVGGVECPELSGLGSNRIFAGKDGIEWLGRNAVTSLLSSRRKPPRWWWRPRALSLRWRVSSG